MLVSKIQTYLSDKMHLKKVFQKNTIFCEIPNLAFAKELLTNCFLVEKV
jgi:hypothetical protein